MNSRWRGIAYAVVLSSALAAGCARKEHDAPVTEAANATPEPTPAPSPSPGPRTPPPSAAKPSAPPAAKAPAVAPSPVASAPTPAPTVAPAPAPTVDLNALEAQLRETRAIGLLTKLTLKNQVDDLLAQFREHYQGQGKPTMAELRRSYDLLIMKVLSLLQDEDKNLASNIVSSREAIWGVLADPRTFAASQG